MADLQTYRGNCHCGRFRFTLTVPEIQSAIRCSCGLCEKKGYLWLVPPKGSFQVTKDDENLSHYYCKSLHDQFCNYCGTGVVGEHLTGPLSGQLAVNVRAIQGVNPFKIQYDNLFPFHSCRVTTSHAEEDKQQTRNPSRSEPQAQHLFSCHCAAVQAELFTPLQEQEVKEDNCSSCVRNAYIGVYPTKDQVKLRGMEDTFEYKKAPGYSGISHCKTCGVMVFSNIYGPPISIFDKLPAERKELALAVYHKNLNLKPLNVRTVEGLDLGSITIERTDEGTDGYALDE
ncbi:hypothetical protein M406DRAFT_264248 [Cryphonectria parasitica EP155]|uniref:CENP-V/GFA domain-containing protein n=1 Tax=Cryphonectria parasitica (strain ATCC 38755 / EP155) TaxID=660469 RepID=A0A9P4XXS5_CRYP1|nr:uncharacterized protein M406DRAFT_264248 [Cryphonectria parasitica EP155]KAF3762730.1 hypothetical protein M406DRAFT_264248 [Cryphonectria parasitica EP155]